MDCRLRLVVLVVAMGGCNNSQTPGTPDVGDTVEVASTNCPDGLVLWEEYNVCAPRVDDCENPWELPIIGGGCVAIGPRGCPKLWDPDADVDCDPGELMDYDGSACPEGFVLTEDEVACIPFFEENCGEMEIPVLGGGCKRVGPEWGVEGEPLFDYCEPGHLALPGGGCVMVGPRACPKLWDPDADVDCEVGDVLPCKDGWSESEDGMYCDPGYGECGPGERALVGGACERVIPLAEDCPPGPFPDVPEEAMDVVYVLVGSECADKCGSQKSPYASIQAAIDVAPDAGYVLVGEGSYAEGVAIGKPLHIVGLCPAKTLADRIRRHSWVPRSPGDCRAGYLWVHRCFRVGNQDSIAQPRTRRVGILRSEIAVNRDLRRCWFGAAAEIPGGGPRCWNSH